MGSQPKGIIHCENWSSAFCIEYSIFEIRKTVELSISVLLLIITTVQIILHICREAERCTIKSKYIILTTMMFSLICNTLHCLFHEIVYYFDFETFFFNLYFLTIVYYVFLKLLDKVDWGGAMSYKILRIAYVFIITLYVVALICSVALPKKRCQQIWYVFVRCLGMVLAVCLFICGLINNQKEKQKLLKYPSLIKHTNSLHQLWIWIGFNAAAQLFNVIQNSNSERWNFALTFVMLCLTYYMAIIPTLWMFWIPCTQTVQTPKPSEEAMDMANGIEIVASRSSHWGSQVED